MSKYLVEATYVGQGIQGLRAEGGSARREVVEKACAGVGGKLESLYYCFGDRDLVAVMDLPDNATAAGFALMVESSGRVSLKTTPLLTPEEVDAATKVGADYRAPGT